MVGWGFGDRFEGGISFAPIPSIRTSVTFEYVPLVLNSSDWTLRPPFPGAASVGGIIRPAEPGGRRTQTPRVRADQDEDVVGNKRGFQRE